MNTVFAWTEPGHSLPGFVNISTDGEGFIIHLRPSGSPDVRSLKIDADVFASMWAAIGAHKGVPSLVNYKE